MAELMDILDAFSNPLKIGWVVWVAWGIGQVFWYRQERKPQWAPKSAVVPSARKPVAVKKAAPAPAPVVQRFVTPEPVFAPSPPPPVVMDTPAFDPSTAVVETFAAPAATDLDSFVADFEMRNNHQRRRRPDPPGDNSSFGAEAPQST